MSSYKTPIIFVFMLFLHIFSLSSYEIIDSITLTERIRIPLLQLNENIYLSPYLKTYNIIEVDVDSVEIINKIYTEDISGDGLCLGENKVYALTWFNGIDIYDLNGNNIIYNCKIGPVTNGYEVCYNYGLFKLNNFLMQGFYIGTIMGDWIYQFRIYDVTNNYDYFDWIPSDNSEIEQCLLINDYFYLFQWNGDIHYCPAGNFSNLENNLVEYEGTINSNISWADMREDHLYIFFKLETGGFLRVFDVNDDFSLSEIISIYLPVNNFTDLLIYCSNLYAWGWTDNSILFKYNLMDYSYDTQVEFDQIVTTILPVEDRFILFGNKHVLTINYDLETLEYLIMDQYDIYVWDTCLDRFALYQGCFQDGSVGDYKIYDIIHHSQLNITIPESYVYLDRYRKRQASGNLIFQYGNTLHILSFNDDSYEFFPIDDIDTSIYNADLYNNLIAIQTYQQNQYYCDLYELTSEGTVFLARNLMSFDPYVMGYLKFVDMSHIIVYSGGYGDSFLYYYLINEDYTLTLLESYQVHSNNVLITHDKIIVPGNGSPVLDTSNPDDPYIYNILDLPFAGSNYHVSSNNEGAYLFDCTYQIGILDENFQIIESWGDYSFCYFLNDNRILLSDYDRITIAGIPELVAFDDEVINLPDNRLRNYPNPFNPSTCIEYSLPENCREANLDIFNTKGQIVKTYPVNPPEAGHNSIIWDGTDQNGQQVSSGLYIIRLQIEDEGSITRKCILLK